MLKKLKSKIIAKKSRFLTFFALGFLVFPLFVAVFPQSAGAQNSNEPVEYNASQIVISSDILINGKKDNFVRVGADSGSFSVQMVLTLERPDRLVLNRDKVIFPSSTTRNKTIIGFGATGAGAEGVEAGEACKDQSHTGFGFVGSVTYRKCDGSIHNPPTDTSIRALNAYDTVTITFNVTSGQFAGLGVDNVKKGESSGLNQVIVWPAIWLDYAVRGDDFITIEQAAQSIYIELYENQAEANQHINDPRPAGIPAYDSSSGAAKNVGAGGSGLLGFMNQLIGIILGAVTEIIFIVFHSFIAPLLEAVLSIHTYTDAFVAVIYPGWELVRNISNIFFIVALIAIGLATLFRLQSYQFRHLLIQLIIAALLVNFSLVIGQAVLALADTMQGQFLPNYGDAIKNLGRHLMVAYRGTVLDGFLDFNHKGYFSNTIQPLFFFALSLGSFMVFLAIGAFLVIRIVMLWILLMVSPIAYVAGVLPSTEHYRKEWWTTFLKYAFFTPIMAFFLNIAAYIATTYSQTPILQRVVEDPTIAGLDNGVSAFVFKTASNVLLLVFLIVALKVSESFGIYGASAISGIAKKGIFAPFALTGMGAKAGFGAAARAYTRWTTKNLEAADKAGKKGKANAWRAAQFLNLKLAKKAYEERIHEKEEEAYEPATGYLRDSINRIIPTEWHKDHKTGKIKLGQKTYYGRLAQAAMIGKKRSLWEKLPLSEEEKNRAKLDAHHIEDLEALEYTHMDGRHEDGYMITWMKENGVDKIVKEELITQLRAQKNSDGSAKYTTDEINGIVNDYGMAYYDPVEYVDLIAKKWKEAGMSDEQVGEKLSHLQEHAEGEKKQRGLGMSMNEWDGRFRSIWDFSGYEKLEKDKEKGGTRVMLEELQKLNIFDESKLESEGKLIYKIKDEMGEDVGEEYEIKDFASLKTAINESAKLHSNSYDRSNYEQADLGYMLAGARGIGEFKKRMVRTPSEQAASNIEPAAYMRQFENGKFRGYTSRGRMSIETLADSVTTSFQQTRVVQDRSAMIAGIYKDKRGKYNFNPNTGTIDYHQMGRAFFSNPRLASAIISRAGFNVDDLEEIKKVLLSPEYSKYLARVPKDPDTGQPELFIRAPSERLGATFIFQKPGTTQNQEQRGGGGSGQSPIINPATNRPFNNNP